MIFSAALAATLATWTGPGDRACNDRCPMEWALEQLPAETQAELATVMRTQPHTIFVRDGDYLSLMTYFTDRPLAQHGVVADLEAPEPATGWCVESGCFIEIWGCSNWAFLTNTGGHNLTAHLPRGSHSIANPRWPVADITLGSAQTGVAYGFGRQFTGNVVEAAPGGGETPPPVPLPPTAWLLIAAVAALAWRSRR